MQQLPNTLAVTAGEGLKMEVVTLCQIYAGEEIAISYGCGMATTKMLKYNEDICCPRCEMSKLFFEKTVERKGTGDITIYTCRDCNTVSERPEIWFPRNSDDPFFVQAEKKDVKLKENIFSQKQGCKYRVGDRFRPNKGNISTRRDLQTTR